MNEIRVLLWIFTGGAEPDLPFFFVDAVDAAHDVVAFGDGGKSRRRGILTGLAEFAPPRRRNEIEMAPAVALGDVDDLVTLFEPVDEIEAEIFDVSRPNERVGFLVDDVARLAGLRIDFNYAQALMTPIRLLIHEAPFVGAPMHARPEPLVLHAIDFGFDLLLSRDIEQVDFVGRKLVARQSVGARLKFGTSTAPWGGLDEVNFFALTGFGAERDQRFGIGRPGKTSVGEAFLSVLAELHFLRIGFRTNENVMFFDRSSPLAVR